MHKTKITRDIAIAAPKEQVWRTMLDDASYRQWAAAFCEGSYFEGDWSTGSIMLFKSPDGEGLQTRILDHQPAQCILAEHEGFLQGGKPVDTPIPEEESWKGFRESYFVEERDGVTTLRIEQDITPRHADYFGGKWDEALQRLKTLVEAS